MPTDLLRPEEIDFALDWPPRTTRRLVRQGKLPHYVLPDGSIRLRMDEITPLVKHVMPTCRGEAVPA